RHLVLFATDRAMGRLESDAGSFKSARRRLKTTGFYRTTPAIRSIQALCGSNGPEGIAARAAQQHLGLALFVQCLGEIERSGPVSGASAVELGAALINEIKDLIATNVDKDLPLDHIANRFGISRRHMTMSANDVADMRNRRVQSRESYDESVKLTNYPLN